MYPQKSAGETCQYCINTRHRDNLGILLDPDFPPGLMHQFPSHRFDQETQSQKGKDNDRRPGSPPVRLQMPGLRMHNGVADQVTEEEKDLLHQNYQAGDIE